MYVFEKTCCMSGQCEPEWSIMRHILKALVLKDKERIFCKDKAKFLNQFL